MPPLVLFHMQRFFSSEKTCSPAFSSSPIWRQSMNTYAIAPSRQRRSSQSIDQEACELIFIHLAHAHRKVAMADSPGATDMAVDRNIVGRISTDQVDGFITEKRRIGARFARIAAN